MAGQRATMAKPECREKMRCSRKRVEAERRDDPAWRAYKQEGGRRLRAFYDASPEAQAAQLATRASVGRKLRAKALAWCPIYSRC